MTFSQKRHLKESKGAFHMSDVTAVIVPRSPDFAPFRTKSEPLIHPLELFDRFRRWLGWFFPGRKALDRNPQQLAPDRSNDWLLAPASIEEARLLFPQLDEERAFLRYQQLRLEMRERDGRGFFIAKPTFPQQRVPR